MKTKNLFLSGVITLVLLTSFISIVVAEERVTYDFDEVNVLYAVSFEANPETNQARSGISQEEWYGADQSWLKDLITDSNPTITVLYGVVELKKEGQELFKEEFIKISGERGSRRFLLNSQQFEYYDDNNLKQIYSFFWSAKVLEGNSIVKDFTEPVDSVIFMRKLQPSGEATNFYLSFFTGAEKGSQSYQSMTFPIMYSLYKPIAEYGEATATAEE